jgi:hypothetical protein
MYQHSVGAQAVIEIIGVEIAEIICKIWNRAALNTSSNFLQCHF